MLAAAWGRGQPTRSYPLRNPSHPPPPPNKKNKKNKPAQQKEKTNSPGSGILQSRNPPQNQRKGPRKEPWLLPGSLVFFTPSAVLLAREINNPYLSPFTHRKLNGDGYICSSSYPPLYPPHIHPPPYPPPPYPPLYPPLPHIPPSVPPSPTSPPHPPPHIPRFRPERRGFAVGCWQRSTPSVLAPRANATASACARAPRRGFPKKIDKGSLASGGHKSGLCVNLLLSG